MNRYTQITPAGFDPLSVEEIMLVPLGKQKMHDEQQETLAEAGIIDANRIAPDEEAVRETISNFKSEIENVSEELSTKGISKGLIKNVISLKKEREHLLSQDGILGRAETAHKAFMENIKNVNSNKDLSMAQKHYGIQKAISDYEAAGGAKGGATYNPYVGAKKVEFMDRALKYANELSPQVIKRLAEDAGFYQLDDGTGWIKGTVKTTTLPIDVIAPAVANAMASDTEVVEYLADLDSLGIDVTANLQNAIMAASALKVRGDREDSISASNIRGGGSTQPNDDDTGPYITESVGPQQFAVYKYKDWNELNERARAGDVQSQADAAYYKRLMEMNPEFQKLVAQKENLLKNRLVFNDTATQIGLDEEKQKELIEYLANTEGKISVGTVGRYKFGNGHVLYRSGNSKSTVANFKNYNVERLMNAKLPGVHVVGTIDNPYDIDKKQKEIDNKINTEFDRFTNAQVSSYNFKNLDNADRNRINKELRLDIISGDLRNYSILNVSGQGKGSEHYKRRINNSKKDEQTASEIIQDIRNSDKESFEFLGLQYNSYSNTPSVTISYNSPKFDNEAITVELALNTLTGMSGIDSGESYMFNVLEQFGGEKGKLVANNFRNMVRFKSFTPNARPNAFSEESSNKFKYELLSEPNRKLLENKYGDDFKLNIYTNLDGIDAEYFANMKFDGNKQRHMSWSDILSIDDLESTNPRVQAKIQKLMVYALQKGFLPEPSYSYGDDEDTKSHNEQVMSILEMILEDKEGYYPISFNDKTKLFETLSL